MALLFRNLPTFVMINPVRFYRRAFFVANFIAPVLFAVVARADPAMWVIRDNDSTVYLIGTVHLLKHETEWNRSKVMKALADSSELWLEVADMNNQAAVMPVIQQYGFDKEHRLSSKLSLFQNSKLSKVAAQYNLPVANLEPMRPWMAALMFVVIDDLLVEEVKAKAPELNQKLLVERNIRWSEKIDGILNRSGVQLIAVGAAHIAGPDSVQTQLLKRGIKVEPY